MKARTKKVRWLLIALLFGFLAIAGLTLVHHHGSPTVAQARSAAAPAHAKPQQPDAALLAPTGGKHGLRSRLAVGTYVAPEETPSSNGRQLRVTGRSNELATAFTGPAWSSHGAAPAAESSNVTPAPGNSRPAASGASPLPQDLGNGFAYNGHAPLDCELPAGCGAGGASGGMGYLSREPSGSSGGAPIVHNTEGSDPVNNGSTPKTDGGTNKTGDTGNTANTGNTGDTGDAGNVGQGSGTPGQSGPQGPQSDPVASAPELDPATLAGALTLLLGSLAVLRRRRAARASR